MREPHLPKPPRCQESCGAGFGVQGFGGFGVGGLRKCGTTFRAPPQIAVPSNKDLSAPPPPPPLGAGDWRLGFIQGLGAICRLRVGVLDLGIVTWGLGFRV